MELLILSADKKLFCVMSADAEAGAGDTSPLQQKVIDTVKREMDKAAVGAVPLPSDVRRVPQRGSVWLHRNGNMYTVLGVSNMQTPGKPDYQPTVHYIGANGNEYSRELKRWLPSSMRLLNDGQVENRHLFENLPK